MKAKQNVQKQKNFDAKIIPLSLHEHEEFSL